MGYAHAMLRLMPKRSIDAERRYEAAGKRPGVQIALRLSDSLIAKIDRARGKKPRATWIKELIEAALPRRREKE
jgi:hypothetical protein